MARLRIAQPTVNAQGITKDYGPVVRNESTAPATHEIGIAKDWRYKVRIDDSASLFGLKATGVIPYLERTLQATQGWSFSETQTFAQKVFFDIPARAAGRLVIEWRPLSCQAVLVTETTDADLEFSIDAGLTCGLEVEVMNLD